jgi:ribosome biogenesis GTPase / thiamine phosphate phosphatase
VLRSCAVLDGAWPPAARACETKERTIMVEFDFEALSALGLTPALASRAAALAVDADAAGESRLALARITEVHRETVVLNDGREELSARALPRLVRGLFEEGTALAAGDWVLARIDRHGDYWVTQRLPPTSHIARRDSDGRSHPIVSNVDIALLVMGLDDDFNPRRLERFLALVQDDAIVPVVVLTKLDVAELTPEVLDAQLATLRDRVPSQIDVVAVNALDAAAERALRHYLLRGTTLVMLGSSGAGKSTLTNTLLGAHVQDTGAVRENDGRGKHTTTSRSLHRLPGGACVIDTPGLRTLRPEGDESSLAQSFADIDALATKCRFRDCRHGLEPGCAVREGVDADRLRNYQKLLRELRRDTLTPLDRQKQVALWKARGKAAKERMKQKRGEAGLS